MYPGNKTPSVVLDTISEIDDFSVVTNYVHERLPLEVAEQLGRMLPNFNAIMSAHERIMPLADQHGTEVNQTPVTLDETQVALLSIYTFAASKGHKDQLVRARCRELLRELGANYVLSLEMLGMAPQPDDED